MNKIKVALAQMNIVWEDFQANYEKIEKFTLEASNKNCDIVLFPEMSFSGFTMDITSIPINEEYILNGIKQLSIKYDINIAIGYAVNNKVASNKYVVVDYKGNILINYTKIHPFSYGEETKYYKNGEKICFCRLNDFVLSTFICYDLRFPEIFQLASCKANIISVAANWPEERSKHWITLLKARAIENQCYIIGVNRVGKDKNLNYIGQSIIVDPNGEILNDIVTYEKLIIADLKIDEINNVKNKFDIKKDRREKLYRRIKYDEDNNI